MQAVTQPHTVPEAQLRYLRAGGIELCAGGGTGHEDDVAAGELQCFDGRPILLTLYDKFEPRALCGQKGAEHIGAQGLGAVIAGVCQFGRYVPLVDP